MTFKTRPENSAFIFSLMTPIYFMLIKILDPLKKLRIVMLYCDNKVKVQNSSRRTLQRMDTNLLTTYNNPLIINHTITK